MNAEGATKRITLNYPGLRRWKDQAAHNSHRFKSWMFNTFFQTLSSHSTSFSFVWPFQNISSVLILNLYKQTENENAQISANIDKHHYPSHTHRDKLRAQGRDGERDCVTEIAAVLFRCWLAQTYILLPDRLDNLFISHCLDPLYHFYLHCLPARVCARRGFYQSTSWAEKK